eukprot:2079769-Alexandrium_andersonii.AAC.1
MAQLCVFVLSMCAALLPSCRSALHAAGDRPAVAFAAGSGLAGQLQMERQRCVEGCCAHACIRP